MPGWTLLLRLFLAASGLFVVVASGLLVPLYRARPDLIRGEPSVLLPPGLGRAALVALSVFAVALALEWFLRRRRGAARGDALRTSAVTYTPLIAGHAFLLSFGPGLPFVPGALWWLVVDGRPWALTLVAGSLLWAKLPGFELRSRVIFAAVVFATIFALTPERRFSQPYDERWGTGDEPRYVRITASLLHDGDAEIGNAEAHIGRRVSPGAFVSSVFGWVPSLFSTAWEALVHGADAPGQTPRYLGGPVIEGRDGGLYYAFLPGFPLLLTPAMAIDSYVDPSRLYVTLFICLVLGGVLVLLLARLVEPLSRTRTEAFVLAFVLGFTLPLYFYHYQMYTEVTAAIFVTLMLLVLTSRELTLKRVVLFALVAAYLPWLHGKYLPIWGIAMAAFTWKAWREKLASGRFALALGLPSLGLALNCLFVFHITGSLMPDALWVIHGYERSGMLVSRTTLPGLHYLFLGRIEGLFVYAPHLALALPGLVSLYRKSRFALVVGLALVVPYVLAAASHDQGGAGAWSPPGRYLVPVIPVFAMALAAWLASERGLRYGRFAGFIVLASGSFWISQAMLAEFNFPYDRPAFLASLVVDPSPLLESAFAFPLMLVSGLVCLGRFAWPPRRLVWALPLLLVLAASLVPLSTATPRRALRLRAAPAAVELDCNPLRLRSVSEASAVDVWGPGVERRLVVPVGVPAEIDLPISPVRRFSRVGLSEHRVVMLHVESGAPPVDVDARCR